MHFLRNDNRLLDVYKMTYTQRGVDLLYYFYGALYIQQCAFIFVNDIFIK